MGQISTGSVRISVIVNRTIQLDTTPVVILKQGEFRMNQSEKMVSVMSVLVLLFAVNASGQEKHIKRSDLPPAVQKTADEQSKGATVRGYAKEMEKGKMEYEVETIVNGHTRDVSMDPDGRILEIEEEVALDTLAPTVREGLQKKAGKGTITKVETITKHDTLVAYEAQVRTAGRRSEVQVGPDGKPLDHQE
jgi:biopolymer transport protein ExbD